MSVTLDTPVTPWECSYPLGESTTSKIAFLMTVSSGVHGVCSWLIDSNLWQMSFTFELPDGDAYISKIDDLLLKYKTMPKPTILS